MRTKVLFLALLAAVSFAQDADLPEAYDVPVVTEGVPFSQVLTLLSETEQDLVIVMDSVDALSGDLEALSGRVRIKVIRGAQPGRDEGRLERAGVAFRTYGAPIPELLIVADFKTVMAMDIPDELRDADTPLPSPFDYPWQVVQAPDILTAVAEDLGFAWETAQAIP